MRILMFGHPPIESPSPTPDSDVKSELVEGGSVAFPAGGPGSHIPNDHVNSHSHSSTLVNPVQQPRRRLKSRQPLAITRITVNHDVSPEPAGGPSKLALAIDQYGEDRHDDADVPPSPLTDLSSSSEVEGQVPVPIPNARGQPVSVAPPDGGRPNLVSSLLCNVGLVLIIHCPAPHPKEKHSARHGRSYSAR